jgi:hypothetical protein
MSYERKLAFMEEKTIFPSSPIVPVPGNALVHHLIVESCEAMVVAEIQARKIHQN